MTLGGSSLSAFMLSQTFLFNLFSPGSSQDNQSTLKESMVILGIACRSS